MPGIVAADAFRDRLELAPRAVDRGAGSEPTDHVERMIGAIGLRRRFQRHPDIRRRKIEARRHHADDDMRCSVERNRAADDIRIGTEVLPPRGVAQRNDGSGARAIVIRREAASDHWRDAEHVE